MALISLVSVNGEVPEKSGLNWGVNSKELNGSVNTSIADAELRITAKLIRGYSEIFLEKNKINNPVTLIWDDGMVMDGSFEQNITVDGKVYAKALCSYEDKSLLGTYLRKRLGVNQTKKITKDDLTRYGRDNIEITKRKDGEYFLDFSI